MAVGDPTPGSLQPGQYFVNFVSRRQFIGVPTSIDPDGFLLISDHLAQDAAIATKADTAYVDAQVATKSPIGHTHAISEIPGLQAALDANNSGGFTPGMIMMWSGSLASIPAGWALCDGVDGRPDLRDRFLLGAGNTYSVGQTGGAHTKTWTTQIAGDHAHSGYTEDYVLTTLDIPEHDHLLTDPGHLHAVNDPGHSHAVSLGAATSFGSYNLAWNTAFQGKDTRPVLNAKTGIRLESAQTGVTMAKTGGGQAHKHAISSGGAHSHTLNNVDVRPAFYALAFIIKLAPEA